MIEEVLNDCSLEEIDGLWYLFLPKYEIESFQNFKKAMENILGRYKKFKKRPAFYFEDDPSDYISVLKTGEKIDIKKNTQFFATPEDLVDEIIDAMGGLKYGERILEPSAGDGAMIQGLFRYDKALAQSCEIEVCENWSVNKLKLQRMGLNLVCDDFMDLPLTQKYDLIIANPPFSGGQAEKHLFKMLQHLDYYGRIACVLPASVITNKKIIEGLERFFGNSMYTLEKIDAGCFRSSGTNVATAVLYATNFVDLKTESLESINKRLQQAKGYAFKGSFTEASEETKNIEGISKEVIIKEKPKKTVKKKINQLSLF